MGSLPRGRALTAEPHHHCETSCAHCEKKYAEMMTGTVNQIDPPERK